MPKSFKGNKPKKVGKSAGSALKITKNQKKGGVGACKTIKDEGTLARLLGTRERLNLARLQKLVVREADALTNWAPPPPPPPPRPSRIDEDGIEHFKRKKRSGPEDWVLRGAARPWESLNDGTLDPNGRAYDIKVDGEDLFATAKGRFWRANGDAKAHVVHLRELACLLSASGRRAESLAHGCQALELDTSDGGGGRSSRGSSDSRGRSGGGGDNADDDDAPGISGEHGNSGDLARTLLGFPHCDGISSSDGSGGGDLHVDKKARAESSTKLAAGASVAHGPPKALRAALASTAPSLRRRALAALKGAAAESTDAAAAAALVALAVAAVSVAGGGESAAAAAQQHMEACCARNPFLLWCVACPEAFTEAQAAHASYDAPGARVTAAAAAAAAAASSATSAGEPTDGAAGPDDGPRIAPKAEVGGAAAAAAVLRSGWALATEALRYASAEGPVWAWAGVIGESRTSGGGGHATAAPAGVPTAAAVAQSSTRGMVHAFLAASPSAGAAPGEGADDSEFPVARRFAAALTRARRELGQ